MNKTNMPKIYYQFVRLRKLWSRSQSESKDEMLAMFDEYIKELEEKYNADETLVDFIKAA